LPLESSMIRKLVAALLGRGNEDVAADEPLMRAPPRSTGSRFSAVTVEPASPCCEAARQARGQKVLATHAPRLPLPDCSMPEHCACRYQKHPDRRAGGEDRRVHGLWQPGIWRENAERRLKKGRRADDRRA